MNDRNASHVPSPTSSGHRCDVFIEPDPQSGAWNMAIDAALLERCLATERCHLRLYRWSEPTLSLGYFQSDESEIPAKLSSLPRVRRLSGGGAILHDRELTYSCTVPPGHPLARHPVRLYDAIHSGTVAVLAEFGCECRPRGDESGTTSREPFLCFARADARDVLFGQHKVLGSAQRRRKGAVLQHGSLLLHRSAFAADFPGLLDLTTRPLANNSVAFEKRLAGTLAARLGTPVSHAKVPPQIEARATEIGDFS